LLKGGEGGVILEIRERLIRIEEGQKALNQRIDELDKRLSSRIDELDKRLSSRIDELDKRLGSRIDNLEKRMDYLVNLIYVVLAGMFTLVGFVLWDRRSALAPAIRRTRDLEEREEKLERAIKEFALKNPDMKEILKSLGLL
jgi:DNA repair exonuclease SbcCD ATPase subunit